MTFVCRKCKKERADELNANRRGQCRICDSHRPHKGSFEQYESDYFARLAMQRNPLKPCACCGVLIKRDEAKRKGVYCAECAKAKRVEERQRAAEKQVKVYVPGGLAARRAFDLSTKPHDAHVIDYQKALAKASKLAAKASERAELIKARPWLNPDLSDAAAYRLRYRLDTEFQIKERLRRQLTKQRKRDGVAELVRFALKRNGNSPTAEKMLGYTMAELRTHIERQFVKGMTWDQFMDGDIHIDHIIPQAAFNLSDADEWKQCWCLSNLRPMWAKDNMRKSAKVECLL